MKNKGCILIPDFSVYCLNPGTLYCRYGAYIPLFQLIEKNLGFKSIVLKENNFEELYDYDVIITFTFPCRVSYSFEKNIYKLSKDVKIIGYFTDLFNSLRRRKSRFNILMERCDKIVYTYDEAFKNRWPQFIEKAEWVPQFLSLSDYVKNLKINENPINKCLVSGRTRRRHYPLRSFVSKHLRQNDNIDFLKHPKYIKNEALIKYDYLNFLHKYRCCLSSCSAFKCVVRKNFEIPSTGSILLSDTCEDMKKLGFIPSVNYVDVNKENFEKKVRDILNHPEDYEHIRENGRKFVLENHTEYHRFEQLKRIIEEL